MLSFFQGLQPASAEIPTLANPWLGYSAVAGIKAFIFSVTADGEFGIQLLTKGGGEVPVLPITLQFLATETLPDGSVRDLSMKLDIYMKTCICLNRLNYFTLVV